jgi:hypothetical protein
VWGLKALSSAISQISSLSFIAAEMRVSCTEEAPAHSLMRVCSFVIASTTTMAASEFPELKVPTSHRITEIKLMIQDFGFAGFSVSADIGIFISAKRQNIRF